MNELFMENVKLSFENCCVVNGERWFFANEFNALCCMGNNNEIVFKGIAPGEDEESKYLFADIKYYNGVLYLIPRGASALVTFNIEQNSFERFAVVEPLYHSKNPYVDYLKFSAGFVYKGKVYMIPRTYPAVIVFDIQTETMQYETEWLDEVENYIFEGEAFFWSDYCVHNNELILVGANNDCIIKRSFWDGSYSVNYVNNDNNGYSGIKCVNDTIVMTSRKNGKVRCFDSALKQIRQLEMPPGFIVSEIIGFSKLVSLGEYLYAIPMWANYFVRIDTNNWKVERVKDYNTERGTQKVIATCCAWTEGTKICLLNNLRCTIDEFDIRGNENSIELKIDEAFRKDYEEKLFDERSLIVENAYFSLQDFLRL